MVSGSTCCCVSLDRCDLLVGLEGFHLMSVARTPDTLVLDVESCNQLAWLDNWQLRGIPCGPISSRVCEPHLMTLPVFAGVRVLGVDERCVASPGPTPTGPP